jgi:hypothetical protein
VGGGHGVALPYSFIDLRRHGDVAAPNVPARFKMKAGNRIGNSAAARCENPQETAHASGYSLERPAAGISLERRELALY